MDILFKRKSTRQYTDERISDKDLELILKAAQSGPSSANHRPYQFIVVRDKDTLAKMADANGKYSQLLKRANVGIVICGDEELAIPQAKEYWVIDASIATQNMCIAATSLGIGNVWLGCWPQQVNMNGIKDLFHLPDHIIPHSVLALGIPENKELFESINQRAIFEENKVHYEKW